DVCSSGLRGDGLRERRKHPLITDTLLLLMLCPAGRSASHRAESASPYSTDRYANVPCNFPSGFPVYLPDERMPAACARIGFRKSSHFTKEFEKQCRRKDTFGGMFRFGRRGCPAHRSSSDGSRSAGCSEIRLRIARRSRQKRIRQRCARPETEQRRIEPFPAQHVFHDGIVKYR